MKVLLKFLVASCHVPLAVLSAWPAACPFAANCVTIALVAIRLFSETVLQKYRTYI
jgi:hypothetical protein